MNKIAAVVVTYNRAALLQECLDALLKQTSPVWKIILIDNASTDGTPEILKEKGYLDNQAVDYCRMDTNLGGAGGFYEGIARAARTDADGIWVMDDDTIPTDDCLEKLLEAEAFLNGEKAQFSFLASTIYGANHEFMNEPVIVKKKAKNGYSGWYQYLGEGLITISRATFVSVLFRAEAVRKCGLPCRDYFIWGDDYEYTQRLSSHCGTGYFVGKSVAIHKRSNASNLSMDRETDPKRIAMYHYYYRNNAINRRYYHNTAHPLRNTWGGLFRSFRQLRKANGKIKMKAMFTGYWEALTQYRKFEAYINDQLKTGVAMKQSGGGSETMNSSGGGSETMNSSK